MNCDITGSSFLRYGSQIYKDIRVIKSSTSSFVGIETAAPLDITEIAAAALAILSAGLISFPSAIQERKYPVKVSPAPVVSTALT